MKLTCTAAAVLLACLVCTALGQKTSTSDLDDLKRPLLLTSKEYKLLVEKSKLPWVIFFQDGKEIPSTAEILAGELDAIARVGVVNKANKKDTILADMGLTAETAPAFRAYSYGDDKTDFKEYGTAEGAKQHVLASIPEDLVRVIASQADFESYLVDSAMEEKVPVVLFTDKEGIPDLMKKLALWMGDNFSFGVFAGAPEEARKQLGVESMPQMILMVPQLNKENRGQLAFGSVPYDRKNFGGLKFKNALRFLATAYNELDKAGVISEAFASLSGKRDSKSSKGKKEREPEPVQFEQKELFEITAETPDYCSESKLGLCIVGFYDGSPLNANKEEQLKVLRDVQAAPSSKGRALHFMWVDITCHSAFGQAFDVAPDNAPIVVAISGKKKAFAKYIGSYGAKEIETFISGVLSGKVRIAPVVGALPSVSASEDCEAIHAASIPPPEEEVCGAGV